MEPRSDARTPSHVTHPKRCYWLEWLVAVCFGPPEGETAPLRPASHPTLLEEESWLLVFSFACFVFSLLLFMSRGARDVHNASTSSAAAAMERALSQTPLEGCEHNGAVQHFGGGRGLRGSPPSQMVSGARTSRGCLENRKRS